MLGVSCAQSFQRLKKLKPARRPLPPRKRPRPATHLPALEGRLPPRLSLSVPRALFSVVPWLPIFICPRVVGAVPGLGPSQVLSGGQLSWKEQRDRLCPITLTTCVAFGAEREGRPDPLAADGGQPCQQDWEGTRSHLRGYRSVMLSSLSLGTAPSPSLDSGSQKAALGRGGLSPPTWSPLLCLCRRQLGTNSTPCF